MIDDALLNNVISARELIPEGRRVLGYFKEKSMLEELYSSYIMKSITVSDTEIESFYREHQNDFETLASVKLKAISSKEREKLEAARARIAQGEDFGAVAAELSDDRSAAARGGDIGWISKGMLPEKIDEQIFSLKPGDVTAIVEFPDGFKIYKIEDTKGRHVRPLDEVKEKIKNSLMRSKASAEKDAWLLKLKERAKIRIIDKNIKKGADILQAEFSKKLGETAASAEIGKEESNGEQQKKAEK
jgi:parvulin-like peptidyl-prolyl isomerase